MPDTDLPAHIEDAVRAIARLHDEHERAATPIQRAVDELTAALGRPRFVGILTLVIAAWIGGNLLARGAGLTPADPPPFYWLQGAMAMLAVYMTTLILTTQRRADDLAARRAQLTLELSILAEQKSAKAIELLEEMRRDSPQLHNRPDPEAAAMATPADPHAMLEAVEETASEMTENEDSR